MAPTAAGLPERARATFPGPVSQPNGRHVRRSFVCCPDHSGGSLAPAFVHRRNGGFAVADRTGGRAVPIKKTGDKPEQRNDGGPRHFEPERGPSGVRRRHRRRNVERSVGQRVDGAPGPQPECIIRVNPEWRTDCGIRQRPGDENIRRDEGRGHGSILTGPAVRFWIARSRWRTTTGERMGVRFHIAVCR